MAIVEFTYFTGIKRNIFDNARLTLNNENEINQWNSFPMQKIIAEDGCPCFRMTVELSDSKINQRFYWGVILDNLTDNEIWGIMTEINDSNSTERFLSFTLQQSNTRRPQQEKYFLTNCRRLGAQKRYDSSMTQPGIQFSVWAPNAKNVEVVFGDFSGYIYDDGKGIDSELPILSMSCQEDGIWQTNKISSMSDFATYSRKPYMFRITKDSGRPEYKTDLYSRCQIGKGSINPTKEPYSGNYRELDGSISCSVIIDPDTVTKELQEELLPQQEFISEEKFWQNEFHPNRTIPRCIEDLVIYELHIGALGYGQNRPGNFEDAINFIPYLVDLGINAVELLPMSEFRDEVNWGYETSHYFAFEYSAGGRDQLKHFIRACHRQGIAVIMDVVYNHYSPDTGRAEWAYDSNLPEQNIYYWYEGNSDNYLYPDGGYVDNLSTGFSPRFHEEMVRKMFISSAVTLVEEFHVDGFRVDQTTSMHLYNVLHSDGRPLSHVNAFGAKFLRELTRTLKFIRPDTVMIAEDHSNWNAVVQSSDIGGLGFDATWYSEFYHNLVGGSQQGLHYANLISTAGLGGNEPLNIDNFASVLANSGSCKVVYHASHDEVGNSYYEVNGNRIESKRTIVAAVNSAPLIGETRRFGEARSRFACGMTMLSAATPMFFMGEEIGLQKPYRYRDYFENKENFFEERQTNGRSLFHFYQDLIRLRLSNSGLRSHNIYINYIHNANRVIAFQRWNEFEEFLIVGSLNNYAFNTGYSIESPRISKSKWQEIFNSDYTIYGGYNVGNSETNIFSDGGQIYINIPANGFIVLQRITD